MATGTLLCACGDDDSGTNDNENQNQNGALCGNGQVEGADYQIPTVHKIQEALPNLWPNPPAILSKGSEE